MKKILLTGSGGFIGRNILESLSSQYEILAPRSQELNLLDFDATQKYLNEKQVDEVIHTAVYQVTRNSHKDPALNLSNNLRMFFNLANCNSLYERMIYFGSGAEYGKQCPIKKVTEADFGKVIPSDDYGFFKYIITKSLPSFPNIYNLRLFGIFGKYEDLQIRFISNAIVKALSGMDITIKKNVVFDYLYIDDFIKILQTILNARTLPYQVMNVCTGTTVELKQLAEIIKKISKKNISINVKEAGLAHEYSAKNILLTESLQPTFSPIKDSVKKLYEWYKKHPEVIDKTKLQVDP